MPLQEIGDSDVGFQFRQDLMKVIGAGIRRLISRERALNHVQPRSLNRLQRKSRLAQQAARDRRLAVHEFGTALRRISELRSRKRMDAATASASRFQYRHPLARPPELAGCHQPCGSGSDDDDVFCPRSPHR
jgi:hypothetical protein